MMRRLLVVLALFAIVAAACGHSVILQTAAENPAANQKALQQEAKKEAAKVKGTLSKGGNTSVNVGSTGSGGGSSSKGGAAQAASSNCATNSNPSQGFTADSLRIGTIIPLSGALRPLGEQTVNVMKVAVNATLNNATHIPGPYAKVDWGCSSRAGVFGRHVSLDVFSLQNNTPEEALAGMRRLVDVNHDFLVRDCYLESNLMGAAVQYENSAGVPGVWCSFSGDGPQLRAWNYSPGTNPNVEAAIHTAYEIEVLHKKHLAILTDPSVLSTTDKVVERVAAYLHHPIPSKCIQQQRAQDAPNGEDSQVAAIRTCYGAGTNVDAVMVSDALNLVFGALSAKNQGWRGADNGVTWDGYTSDWITSLAQICQDACQGAITDCQALPCIPWASPAKFPAVTALQDTYNKYLKSYPEDILTYGPEAITGGLGLWLGMTGPNLSRDAFRNTLAGLHNWDAGIGPVINMGAGDHFGGASVWLIKFTGNNNQPYFDDLTGRFVTLQELHIPLSLTRT
jgi:Periplasmic binding protein